MGSLVQQLVDHHGGTPASSIAIMCPRRGALTYETIARESNQLARYLIDYGGLRVAQMGFDEAGRVVDFGLPAGELDAVIDSGIPFRTSGCPGKFADDVSACDRPYGDSPPSNIASYPFQPNKTDLRKIRRQLGRPKPAKAAARAP